MQTASRGLALKYSFGIIIPFPPSCTTIKSNKKTSWMKLTIHEEKPNEWKSLKLLFASPAYFYEKMALELLWKKISPSAIKQTVSWKIIDFLEISCWWLYYVDLSIFFSRKRAKSFWWVFFFYDGQSLDRSATHLYSATTEVHQSMTWYSPTRFSGSRLSHYRYLQMLLFLGLIFAQSGGEDVLVENDFPSDRRANDNY